ncbi:SulP family inorganic anion transporter [Maribacter sp. 2307ULW6-5]|uniref:SulP family inorganic anion transporter n=1 Tax=Maribacter sp. 2307ULW6-5 TaxID=3386275 RepID=UPI0039BD8480
MRRFLPFLEWASTYKRDYLPKDLVGGLTVGIVLVPQGMAYAMIAGLPPVYGLYASLFPVLTYALLGTSRKIAVGPVAMDSLLVAAGLGTLTIVGMEHYLALLALLTLMVGAIQLVLGVLQMGFLVHFLSRPVISGFTSAAALIIILSQLKHLLGVSLPGSSTFHELVLHAVEGISRTNPADLLVGAMGIGILVAFKLWRKNFPAILLIVVLGIAGTYFFNLEQYGLKLVGNIAQGLPRLSMPQWDWESLALLLPMALALALVGYLEAISIGKALQDKAGEDTIRPNQEFIGLGSANIVGSFLQAFPVTASFSRSAINHEAGTKTNLGSIFSVLLVLFTLLFLTPVFAYLPKAILASIIMVSVFGLINVPYARSLWEGARDEFWVLVITFLMTLFVGIAEGILLGTLIALLLLVYRTSRPHFAVLGQVAHTDYYKNVERFGEDVLIRKDLLIVRFDAQLYFGNATYFKKGLLREVQKKGAELKGVILNAEPINYIDATGTETLIQIIGELQRRGIGFYIAGAIGPARDIIFNSDIGQALDRDHLFVKTHEAVAYFDDPKNVSEAGSKVAHESKKKN